MIAWGLVEIMGLGNKIKQLREKKGLTQVEMARLLSIQHSTISQWETGKRTPDYETLRRLAGFFGVTVSHLLGEDDPNRFTLAESRAIYGIDAQPAELVPIPRYGEIHAALPAPPADQIVGYDWYPAEQVRGGEFFTLVVRGDCMAGGRMPILPGHVVLVRKQPEVDNGNIAVVWWNGEDAAHLRRVYYRDGKVMLVADNPAYPPELLPPAKVTIIGKVVEVKFEPAATREL